jgi:hypothetical protein
MKEVKILARKQSLSVFLNNLAAVMSFINAVFLFWMHLKGYSMPLAGVFCFTGDCNPLVYSVTGKLSFALAGAITAIALTVLILLARQIRPAQFLALLLSLFSVAMCIYFIHFEVRIIESVCVLCLISDALFFLTLIALGAASLIQIFCRKCNQDQISV